MSPQEEQLISARNRVSQAGQDAHDIRELEKYPPFHRYFQRRLKQKHDEIEQRFKYDPPTICSLQQREALRNQMLAYEDLVKMLKDDMRAAVSLIEAPPPGPPRPTQVG